MPIVKIYFQCLSRINSELYIYRTRFHKHTYPRSRKFRPFPPIFPVKIPIFPPISNLKKSEGAEWAELKAEKSEMGVVLDNTLHKQFAMTDTKWPSVVTLVPALMLELSSQTSCPHLTGICYLMWPDPILKYVPVLMPNSMKGFISFHVKGIGCKHAAGFIWSCMLGI